MKHPIFCVARPTWSFLTVRLDENYQLLVEEKEDGETCLQVVPNIIPATSSVERWIEHYAENGWERIL